MSDVLYLRGLPAETKARLRAEAEREGRSLNRHVIALLDKHARTIEIEKTPRRRSQ